MKIFSIIFSFALLCMLLPSLMYGAEVSEERIEGISFHEANGESESIRFQLTGRVIPDIFIIGGKKPRLVLDFFNTGVANNITNATETSGVLVKRIRMGRHNQPKPKTRIALDLVPLGEYEHTLTYLVNEKVLLVTILRTEGEVAAPVMEEQKRTPSQVIDTQESPDAKVASEAEASLFLETEEKNDKIHTETGKSSPVEKVVAKEVTKEDSSDAIGEKESDKEVSLEKPLSDAKLLNVTFEDTSNKGEMVLFKLNGFYPPIVFGIEKGDPRVVCDFLDTRLDPKVVRMITANGRYVKTVRVAKHAEPSKVRVVMNLAANKNYDLQQVFFKEDNLFVLIINTLEEGAASSSSSSSSSK